MTRTMPETAADAYAQESPDMAATAGSGGGDGVDESAGAASRRTRFIEITSLLVTVAFLSGAGVGLLAGYRPMLARAGELRSRPVEVNFAWPPLAGQASAAPVSPGGEPRTWVNAEVRRSVMDLALRHLSDNPFDESAVAKARLALLDTGWFMDDLRLVRGGDGVVSVSGTWRVPVACVRVEEQDHLVGAGGELLPLAYKPDTSGMKVVLGAAHPLPDPGHAWIGGEVQEALKLLAYLRGMPGYDQLAGVDVAGYSPGRTLVLVSNQGNKIIWGGPPDQFNPGQVAAEVKAQRLGQLLRAYGRIDAGRALVDIRVEPVPLLVDSTGLSEPAPIATGPRSSRPASSSHGAGRTPGVDATVRRTPARR